MLAVAAGHLRVGSSRRASRRPRSRRVPADLRRHPRFGVDRAQLHPAVSRCIAGPAWPGWPSPRRHRGSSFEALCAGPAVAGDPRDYAVAARAVVRQPAGSVEPAGAGAALARRHRDRRARRRWRRSRPPGCALRDCQAHRAAGSPRRSPPATRSRLGRGDQRRGRRRSCTQYLLADPTSSTVVELAMWSTLPPLVAWPAVPRRAGLRRDGGAAVRRLPRLVPVRRSDVAAGRVIAVARVVVHVMPKAEILDPQGQAIVGALGRLGFAGVSDVRQGKRFELEVDDSVDDDDARRDRRIAAGQHRDRGLDRQPGGDA